MKRQVQETVWSLSKYDMPSTVEEFANFVKTAAEALAVMQSREMTFNDDDDYESGWNSLTIYYLRDETDAETTAREAQEAKYIADREARDRREYERLKEKFD